MSAPDLRFGVFIEPAAERAADVLELARLADASGLDYVTFQDHPYQRRFLDAWTLLAVVAAQTTSVRVALNVANLPLRPPFMLAKSVASLDVLSGGRVELGIGAGAFWEGVEAVGGPRRTPGESVDALAEALDVIRAAWRGETIRHDGEHYRVHGARPGPVPAHPVEIWLGAYKPRMLRLTGAKADGWIPSMGYADPADLPALRARVDAAAADAGRDPADIRGLYNVNPGVTPQQLAELVESARMTTFIHSVSSADDIRRFAEETAPAVRELGKGSDPLPKTAVAELRPTVDDGTRVSDERPWDESTRPTAANGGPARAYSPQEVAQGQHLVDVHDALRAELAQLRDLVAQVAAGTLEARAAHSLINRMTIRQNNWTLGAYCEQYCRVVTGHHSLEDRGVFPHLRRREPALAPVLDRLEEEHEVIADVLERVDRALVEMVARPDGIRAVQAAVDLLTDTLVSHFAYEERELVEPLARLGFS